MSEEVVLYSKSQGIATITLNRPAKANTLRMEVIQGMNDSLAQAKPGFDICAGVMVNVQDDVSEALMPMKSVLGFYIGGMGAKKRNFHMELMSRMGFESEAHKIQDLFLEGKRAEAVQMVPDEFADEISLVGPADRIKDRLQAWRETPITTLLVPTQDKATLATIAELVLG